VQEIKRILDDGVALVPVNTKTKAPCVEYKNKEALGYDDLCALMVRFGTNSVACSLGISGICCIDIDSKYYFGVEVLVLESVREYLGEVYDLLRIEKTPSGGMHLLYKLPVGISQGSQKTAKRWSTKEELEINPKEKDKCFIEIKAGVALSQCFPSPGYTIEKESNSGSYVGRLTQDQHCSIMNLIASFNEAIVEDKEKKTGTHNDIYDENPFISYNLADLGDLLLDEGWTEAKGSSRYRYFRKPGRIGKDVDASFHIDKKIYKIWSNKSGLDDRSYSPSGLKCVFLFGGDSKQMYAWLVAQGFGKIKPAYEAVLIKKEARKKDGGLPPNASFFARMEFEAEKERVLEKYPYGIFWDDGEEEGEYKVSRTEFLRVAHELGFRKVKAEFCCIEDYRVRWVDRFYFFVKMHAYFKEENRKLLDVFEAFLQSSGEWSMYRFQELDKSLILRSTADISFKFYSNCYVQVTGSSEDVLQYDSLQKLIWEDKIKDREYKIRKDYSESDKGGYKSLYYDFLDKAIGVDKHLMQCIGYYAHEYRDERGWMVITTEKCEKSEDGGGYGKNIFWNLLSLTTTFKSIPGSQVTFSKDLLQSWDKQRIFSISDLPKDFNLEFFKDIITGNAVVNKKFINEFEVAIEDMPKLGGSSNHTYPIKDGGLKRRIIYVELGDFFKVKKGVDKYYGKMFPKDWEDYDYLWYDNFIHDCIKEFLKCNYEIEKKELSEGGWKKQFVLKSGHLHEFFVEGIKEWSDTGTIESVLFRKNYEKYCMNNGIKKLFGQNRVIEYLIEFCEKEGDVSVEEEVLSMGKCVVFRKKVEVEEAPF